MLLPLLSVALLGAASQANVQPIRVDGELCHPRNLLVKLDSFDRREELQAAGARVVRELPEIGYAVVETPLQGLQRARALLKHIPGVLRVDLDRAALPCYTPNDPMWSDEWHSRAIKADLAWDITKGSSSVIVAVLDTGVDMTHP